jgi:hypothetical protein
MKKHQYEMISKARSKRMKQQHWWLLPKSQKIPKLLPQDKGHQNGKSFRGYKLCVVG